MNCPICHKPVTEGAPDFPFCSERCRTTDLGNWAMEKYVISSPAPPPAARDQEDDGDSQ